jgi:pyrroline-5-carboxylate reductase|tara:strand:- start:2537 stop:3310 length:774 start_codon:yes stop_codon:yes gene_type:complete
MNIGFIGTGKITTSVIQGLFRSKIKLKQILISERNKKNSSALSKQFKKVKVVKNNQDIINNSSWVFIAVVPTVAKKILQELTFKKNQTVVSFVSTLNMNYLKKTIRPATSIVKAAPLPTIASTLGPIILFPNNAKVTKFFNHLGMAIVAKNEQENNHLWAMTATMATFFEYCNTLESWLVKRKVNPNKAKDLIASLMFGLSHSMLLSKTKTKQLVSDYQTKKGINEEFLKGLKQSGTFNAMNSNLTKILERIKKAND